MTVIGTKDNIEFRVGQPSIPKPHLDFDTMSRFHTITVLFVITALGAGFSLPEPIRWLVVGLLLAAYLAIFILGICVLKFNFFVKAACRGDATSRRVALTFDDGPDPAATRNLLQILKHHQIKAAFFPIGRKVRDNPEIIRRIDQEGHILGNHTFRHSWWTNFLFFAGLNREMRTAQEAIEAAIGKVPAYFRPPMGLTNPHIRKALKKNGLSVVGWDVRPFDTTAGPEKVIRRVLKKIRNGSIIALHDTGRIPADLASLTDQLVTKIKERDYTFGNLEELTGLSAYQTTLAHKTGPAIVEWPQPESGPGRGRFSRFVGEKLVSSAYVRRAVEMEVSLKTLKTRPSPRFFFGIGLVLFSYILGWPMVGLFGLLSAYFQAPALLVLGPAFYGFSHLVWMFGMYLAGRDCMKYADLMLSWGVRKAVEKSLFSKRI